MNKKYLSGKVFMVTGSSSGIGYEVTRILLENGVTVFAMVRRSDSVSFFKDKFPDRFNPILGDVANQIDCENFVNRVADQSGVIHGLIHCAGIGVRSQARDITHEVFRSIMDINFYSMVYLYSAARKHMEKTNGHVVAVSSVHGLIALPYRSAYSAAKHALNAYIKSVGFEEKKIHFLCVNYGYVKTGFSVNAVTGNGEKFGKNNAAQLKGMLPEKAANILIDAMIKRKKQITPAGWKERITLSIHKYFPAFFDKLITSFVKPD